MTHICTSWSHTYIRRSDIRIHTWWANTCFSIRWIRGNTNWRTIIISWCWMLCWCHHTSLVIWSSGTVRGSLMMVHLSWWIADWMMRSTSHHYSTTRRTVCSRNLICIAIISWCCSINWHLRSLGTIFSTQSSVTIAITTRTCWYWIRTSTWSSHWWIDFWCKRTFRIWGVNRSCSTHTSNINVRSSNRNWSQAIIFNMDRSVLISLLG